MAVCFVVFVSKCLVFVLRNQKISHFAALLPESEGIQTELLIWTFLIVETVYLPESLLYREKEWDSTKISE